MYNKAEQYKIEIKNILDLRGVEVDEDMLNHATRKLLKGMRVGKDDFLIETTNNTLDDSKELNDDEIDLDIEFVKVNEPKNSEKFDINNYLSRVKNYVFFVESIGTKILLTNALKRKRINYQICFIKTAKNQNFGIKIESRIQSINHTVSCLDNGTLIRSLVVSAKLYDIVNIYNALGDDLFQKNVRLKITKDVNEVESSIFRTLRENPERFWLFNNGITMLINSDGYDIYNSGLLNIKSMKQSGISVINGAQTISSSIDFFNSTDIDTSIIENAINKAYVMLRIICVEGKDEDFRHNIENSISVSLNRQKPIGMEDIAMKTTFVEKLNSLFSENNPSSFRLVRHGEIEGIQTHEMIKVAKILQASKLQKPGSAKNMYARDVLNFSSGKFLHDNIFSKDMVDDEKKFMEEFKGVNCLILLEKIYNDIKNIETKISFDEFKTDKNDLYYFWENSNFYFVALVYYILTNRTCMMKDFPDIDIMSLEKKKDSILWADVFKGILKLFDKVCSEKRKIDKDFRVSYNDLKKDDLYSDVIQLLEDNSDIENEILISLKKLLGIFEGEDLVS